MRSIVLGVILSFTLCIGLSIQTKAAPIHDAISHQDWDAMQHLLRNGADINARNYYGGTALHSAVNVRQLDTVIRLLQIPGIDVNTVESFSGFTPLLNAVFTNSTEIAICLLQDPRIDVNTTICGGNTALSQAAYIGNTEIITRLLQKHDINVNIANRGWTALMRAAKQGHTAIVAQLLEMPDIDVNAKSNNGKTAWDIAKNEEIKELIEDHIFKSTAGRIKSARSGVKKEK